MITEARRWLGTPYRHQASQLGVGADCLGLVRGVWRSVIGPEPEIVPAYRPDWAEADDRERLLAAFKRHFTLLPLSAAQAGDVLLFRMAERAMVKHCAIISEQSAKGTDRRILHAYWGRAVVESHWGPWWQARTVAALAFPFG